MKHNKIILKDFIEEQSDLQADVCARQGKSMEYQEAIKLGVEIVIKKAMEFHPIIIEVEKQYINSFVNSKEQFIFALHNCKRLAG